MDIAAKPAKRKPSEVRLQRLLSAGYFPSELPPTFTTYKFGLYAHEFKHAWQGKKIAKFWTKPEQYSVPRYGLARRQLSIVNPVNQLYVAQLISDNWFEIRKRLHRSLISEFHPKLNLKGNGRAVTGVDFDGVARRRLQILGSFGRYVRTDIARFYASIYTHAIPWAILGKDFSKQNHNDAAFKSSFANYLDKAIGAGQQGQTIGIPIGPDTSRILSELIAVEIEVSAAKHIPEFRERAVRYVDDILIGLNDHETPSFVLSGLTTALYEYELEINAEKTSTVGLNSPHSPEWINFIRNFSLSSKSTSRQRDDMDAFFEHALFLTDVNPKENVLLFAVKRAASFHVSFDNIGQLVNWLLYCARRAPSCLRFVAEYLASIHQNITEYHETIFSYICQQIPIKAEAAHNDEVAWLLFWAREIGLTLPEDLFKNICGLRSSVVAMLSMDIEQQGLIDGTLHKNHWISYANSDGLKSEMWLATYEATKKGWWKANQSFIKNHEYFSALWQQDIEFYDANRQARKKITPAFSNTSAFDTSTYL